MCTHCSSGFCVQALWLFACTSFLSVWCSMSTTTWPINGRRAVAGVFLLVSIHLLLCSLSGSRSKEINAKELLVVQGATGQVNVSLAAIRDMAERLSASVHGVRMAKAKALVERRKDEGDFLKLDIRLEIGQERGIAAISDDVRTQVGRYVTQAAGIDNVELAVSVQGIASGVAVKKRRIR